MFGPVPIEGFDWSIVLAFGTVLEDGEDPGSERALAAAGHAASVQFHYGAEYDSLDERGREWLSAYEDVPADERHLAMHYGHLVLVHDRDRPFVTGETLSGFGLALSAAGWPEQLAQLEAAGATEIAYQPAGPGIPRELEAFAAAVRG